VFLINEEPKSQNETIILICLFFCTVANIIIMHPVRGLLLSRNISSLIEGEDFAKK